jgi:hypothetical protein
MIPKKIHYCWLSGDDMPPQLLTCIDSWKRVMPDYEIILWDKKLFNIESIPFVNEACSVKKWAFACDYIRLYALYTEGGIYLDTDVLVNKPFDEYLKYGFFTSVEYHPSIVKDAKSKLYLDEDGASKTPFTSISGIGIQAAVLGGTKGHAFIKACMDYYNDKHFIHDDGSFHDKIFAPSIFAITAEKYGFRYIDKIQYLEDNMLILPSNIFASTPALADSESFAIHCCAGSWREKQSKKLIYKIIDRLKNNTFIKKIKDKLHLF